MTTITAFIPAAEAAYISNLTDKQIQRAVDDHILQAPLVSRRNGRRFAKLGSALANFYYGFESTLTAEARRKVISLITARLQKRSDWQAMLDLSAPLVAVDWSIALPDLVVDLDHTIRTVQARIARVDWASSQIVEDPEIMGGAPVFAGTRIPIDTVLVAKRGGSRIGEIRQHYPTVSEEQIEAAEIYSLVHPRRGRPVSVGDRNPSWKPIGQKRVVPARSK